MTFKSGMNCPDNLSLKRHQAFSLLEGKPRHLWRGGVTLLISIPDNCREIFTTVAIIFNESTKPDKKWSRNGFAHRLEIWSNHTSISIIGIKLQLGLIPTRFWEFTKHLIAPRCLFSIEYTVDGERLFQALAIGNIIWDSEGMSDRG